MRPLKPKTKKVLIITIALIFGFALGAAGYVAWKLYFKGESIVDLSIISRKSPSPAKTANPLDGRQSDLAIANRHPLAIVIENYPEARPQIGLDKASIIYEAITEGGITRYLTIYGPENAEKLGPVRSLRTFFLDWAWEYNAFLAHVGGNIDALDRVGPEGALDLDQFGLGEKAYWREPERGKAIEHTMFTSTVKLYKAAQEKGYPMEADFTSFKFLNPKSFTINPQTTQKITIDFSSASYKISYEYDAINNNYVRSMAGSLHRDRETGNQLAPTNIIIQEVNRANTPTRINEESWTFDTIGQGRAIVLYGGQKIDATWKKTSLKDRTKFYNSAGKEIEFLPGQFWYEITPPDVFDKVKIETSSSQG